MSELKRHLKCPRAAYLSYEEGWTDYGVEAGIGTYVHALLADYYRDDDEVRPDPELQLSLEGMTIGDKMMSTYIREVEEEGLDVGQETLFVEQRYAATIAGVLLSGGIDHVYYDDTLGGVVIRDHKTVGRFMPVAQRDFQLMTYAWLARDNGIEGIVAFEHNQIKRNKRTSRAKPPFIARYQHMLDDETLDKWGSMLERQVSRFKADREEAEASGQGVESPVLWAIGANDCDFSCSFSEEICGMIDEGGDYRAVLESEFTNNREAPE